jgi:hypothetical protein
MGTRRLRVGMMPLPAATLLETYVNGRYTWNWVESLEWGASGLLGASR